MLAFAPSRPAHADAEFSAFLESLWPDAAALGVSRATFDDALDGLTPDRSLPDLAKPDGTPELKKGQAEFIKSPAAYINERQIQTLAGAGRAKAKAFAAELDGIEARYHVDHSIILAIWGRETNYGGYDLPHNALRVIATQAFLGTRKDYFRNELLWALKIIEDGHVTKAGMKSSWAGAMGLTQFMPTNFRDFAVDFDGDGRRDIWNSVPDSLASTAKSLSTPKNVEGQDMTWNNQVSWGYEVVAPKDADCTLQGFAAPRPIRDWVELGYARTRGRAFPSELLDEPAYLMLPEGTYGPAFLLTRNFLILKTYNFADLYALFVGHLADRIAGGGPFDTPWATTKPMRERDVYALQQKLAKLGHDVGKVDGKVGWRSRVALGLFEKANDLAVDCYPTTDDVAAAKKVAAN